MEQRSIEWYEARKGMITASSVGAILGLSPFMSRADVMRRMVREYYGLEPEFKGNVATEYGQFHEALALEEYKWETGNAVDKAWFVVSPHNPILGASPDGYLGKFGLIEIKCPYGLRNGGEFKSIAEQPHYYAQIQLQLYCTQRTYCDFYQWSAHNRKLERVDIDYPWLEDNIPKLLDFYNDYLKERQQAPVNDADLNAMVDQYRQLVEQEKQISEDKKALLEEIVKKAGNKNCDINGHKLTKVVTAGSISYAKAVRELLPNADLTSYRGAAVEYWKLS